jgi:response regulator of citrate/malate metabolism
VNQHTVASVQFAHQQKTAETLAKEHGVSATTIKRDAKKFEAMEKLEASVQFGHLKTAEET